MTQSEAKELAITVTRDTRGELAIVKKGDGYAVVHVARPGSIVVARYQDGRMVSNNQTQVPAR